jgi:hypothetical protein
MARSNSITVATALALSLGIVAPTPTPVDKQPPLSKERHRDCRKP